MEIKEVTFRDTLARILDLAQGLLQSEAATIFLLDKKKNELVFEIVSGSESEKLRGKRLKVGEGIAGRTVIEGRGKVVVKAQTHPDFAKKFDRNTGFRTQSLLTAPLKIKDDIIGVIELVNKRNGIYNNSDLKALEQFAESTSSILETSLLYERIEQAEQFLGDILDSIPNPIIILNEDGKIIKTNKIFRSKFNGYNADMLKSKIKAAAVKNPPTIIIRKGVFEIHSSQSQEIDEEGNIEHYSIFLLNEITEKIKLAEIEAEKRIREHTIAGLSHYMANPLTPIKGISQLIMEENLDEKQIGRYISRIYKEACRMEEILTLFTTYTGSFYEAKRSKTDIVDLLNELKKRHKWINLRYDKDGYKLNIEKNKVFIALSNFLIYLKENGLQIITLKEECNGNRVILEFRGLEEHITNKIKDTLDSPEIFSDPLSSDSDIEKIRLLIFKNIIEKNGGEIDINNHSTRVTFNNAEDHLAKI